MDNSVDSLSRRAQELIDDESLVANIANPLEAAELFEAAGVCVFHNLFPTRLMDTCRYELQESFHELDKKLALRGVDLETPFRFNEVCRRRLGRFDTRGWGLDGPQLSDQLLRGDNPVLPFVHSVLGEDCVELWRGVVDNRQGSDDQAWHRDGDHVFEHVHLPPHCLTVFIPLVDVTDECGPTQFYPGSHASWRFAQYAGINDASCHLPHCTPLCTRGSAIAFDYRTIHRGTANRGESNRPIFYIVFARPWFRDHNNFPSDNPLCPPPSEIVPGC